MTLAETARNQMLIDLHQTKKEEGDDVYSEMRDKLSIEEDLIAEVSESLLKNSRVNLPKEQRRQKKLH